MKRSLVSVSEAEGSRSSSTCCRITAHQPKRPPLPAAASDGLFSCRPSCLDLVSHPPPNSPHVSSSCVRDAVVAKALASGLWFDPVTASDIMSGRESLADDLLLRFPNSLSRCSWRDPVRQVMQDSCRSHVENGVRLISRTSAFPANSIREMDHSLDYLRTSVSSTFEKPECVHTHDQHINREKRVSCTAPNPSIRTEVYTAPRLHPKLAYKRDHGDGRNFPPIDFSALAHRRADNQQSAAQDLSSKEDSRSSSQGKQMLPKFRKSPPPSLTINMSADIAKAQMIEISGLSSTHRMRFIELIEATQGIEGDVLTMIRTKCLQNSNTSFLPIVVNVCAEAMKTIACRLSIYGLLTGDDKRCLLQGSLTEILFLRSARFFNQYTHSWIFGPVVPQVSLCFCSGFPVITFFRY